MYLKRKNISSSYWEICSTKVDYFYVLKTQTVFFYYMNVKYSRLSFNVGVVTIIEIPPLIHARLVFLLEVGSAYQNYKNNHFSAPRKSSNNAAARQFQTSTD